MVVQNDRYNEQDEDGGDNGGFFLILVMMLSCLLMGFAGGVSLDKNVLKDWMSPEDRENPSSAVVKSNSISIQGNEIAELDLHAFGRPSDISTLAFYGLVHEELGLENVVSEDLKRIQKFYRNDYRYDGSNYDAVERRKKELVIKAGASGIEFGDIHYPSDETRKRLEEIIRSFD